MRGGFSCHGNLDGNIGRRVTMERPSTGLELGNGLCGASEGCLVPMCGLPIASLSTVLPSGGSVLVVGRAGRVRDRSEKQLMGTTSSHGT